MPDAQCLLTLYSSRWQQGLGGVSKKNSVIGQAKQVLGIGGTPPADAGPEPEQQQEQHQAGGENGVAGRIGPPDVAVHTSTKASDSERATDTTGKPADLESHSGAAVFGDYQRMRTVTHGEVIVERDGLGRPVVVAEVRRIEQGDNLVRLARIGAQRVLEALEGSAQNHVVVLAPFEYDSLRRDAEAYQRLRDDVAAGRKVVQDVPASVHHA